MHYGDEHFIEVSEAFDLEGLSRARLNALFRNAPRISAFESTPDHNFIQDLTAAGIEGPLCYRLNQDCMIEINEAFLKTAIVVRNQVADVISFQFVSTVKRSEFLGRRKNIHDLGPALLVSAVPRKEMTYRAPKPNMPDPPRRGSHDAVQPDGTHVGAGERVPAVAHGDAAGPVQRRPCSACISSRTLTATRSGRAFTCRWPGHCWGTGCRPSSTSCCASGCRY